MSVQSQRRPELDLPHAESSPETRTSEGTWIGKFRIVAELGRGGMAVVYEAYDSLLDRPVAIKMLPRTLNHQPTAVQRFLQEARSVARIHHPNIVAVYDADQFQGQYYIVLELVRGRNLQDVIRTKPLDWIEATHILADACRGLAVAHEMGVVHRDIKPSNLIQSGSGCVKLADFGLVRMLESNGPKQTVSGCLLGTPEFMSPEQCRSELADVRSDIYSMGATYFALLTGRPPFAGDAPLLVMNAHLWSAIPDPREINSSIPEACRAIICRAMAKDPDHRYQCMTALQSDLAAVLCTADSVAAGASVTEASPSTAMENFCEQNRSTLEESGYGRRDFSWGLTERSGRSQQNHRRHRPESSENHGVPVQADPDATSLATPRSIQWQRSLLPGVVLAIGALLYCLPGLKISAYLAQPTAINMAIASVANGDASAASESALPATGIQIPGLKRDTLPRPTDIHSWSMDYPGIQRLCVSASGEFLVVLSTGTSASGATQASSESSSERGCIQVWSREGKILVDEMLGGPGTIAVVSKDDGLLAVGTGNGTGVQLWDTTTWQAIDEIPSDAGSRIEAIAFSEDNHWLAFVSSTSKLANSRVIWDLQKQQLVRAETTTGQDPFRAAVFQHGIEPVVQTCTQRGIVETWSNRQESKLKPVLRTGTGVNAVAFSPAGQLVAAGMGPYFAIWNCEDSRREHAVNNVLADVQCVAFSATGREVCWAAGSSLQCLDAKSKRAIASFSTRGGHVVSLAVLPNAAGVWAACDDGKLMFWSTLRKDIREDGASRR